jgi:signal transduction histidine kinase
MLAMPATVQAVMFLPTRSMVQILALLFALALTYLAFLPTRRIAPNAMAIAMGSFMSVGFGFSFRRELQHRRALNDAYEKLKASAAQAEALAAAEERNRLAREIHDGAAHHLTAANVLVEAGLAQLPADAGAESRASLEKAQGQIRSALTELRDSIAQRQPADTARPLLERIRDLIAAGGFPANLTVVAEPRRLATEAEQALYRVAQEALTNARKHAPSASLALTLDFSDATRVTLRAENAQTQPGGASGDGAFGLLSLRERLQRLGGVFRAGEETPQRFVVHAEVPA